MRLAIASTHPIQYHAPLFRYLAGKLDLLVLYAQRQDRAGQAGAGFGVEFDWDVPLLEGYAYRFLDNVARRPSPRRFSGCDTPGVWEVVRDGRFDAVLTFGWSHKSSIQAAVAGWRAGVPVLMRGDSHLSTPRSLARRMLKYLPYRALLPRLQAHLYVGSRNREYLEHYGVPDERLFFAPHCVDNDRFATIARDAVDVGRTAAIRRSFGIPERSFVLIAVGKFIPKKRLHDVVRAAVKLSGGYGEDVHFLFVGDGRLEPELKAMAKPVARQVHFAGFRNQGELPDFYAAADALVLASDAETWGLVANEAMAAGRPVIVSDAAGCAPDLTSGDAGLSYPCGDVDALVNAVLELRARLEAAPDRTCRAIAARIAQYSIPVAADGIERALKAVAK